MSGNNYLDLAAEGFEEVEEPRPKQRSRKPSPPVVAAKSPYVVVENKSQLEVMARSNKLMQTALEDLASKLTEVGKRPKSMDMKFKRNSSGFMESVKVVLEY